MALIDGAIERGGVDATRIGVLGGSYGGILTNWLLGHSDRFKAAVTMRSCSNYISMYGTDDISFNTNVYAFGVDLFDDPELYWRLSPIRYVEKIDAPLLIIHSEQDYRCPIEQAEQLFTSLKLIGRTVEFVRFPNESHGLSRSGSPKHRLERLGKITDWFGRWL
jgi:dipeptidyl aminopeptidase/acylaminoacyl peptidase